MTDPTTMAAWLAGEIVRVEEALAPLLSRRDTLRECLDRLTVESRAQEPDPFAPTPLAAQLNRVNVPPNGHAARPAPAEDDDEPSLDEELEATPDTHRGRRRRAGPGKPDPNRKSDLGHPWNQESEAAAQERAARVNGHTLRVAAEEPAELARVDPRMMTSCKKMAAILHGCPEPEAPVAYLLDGGMVRSTIYRIMQHEHCRTWFEQVRPRGPFRLTDTGRAALLDQDASVGDAGLLPVRRKIAAVLAEQGSGLSYETLQVRTGLKTSALSEALDCDFFRRESGRFVLTPLGNNVLRED